MQRDLQFLLDMLQSDVNLNIVLDAIQTEVPTLIAELKLRFFPES